ncbi:alpha/beta hydrolase [soil metagenome]
MTAYFHTGGQQPDSGPTVVFVHGAGMDHTVWRFQTRWLANRDVAVFAPDLPGHGLTPGSPPGSIEEAAAWLADSLEDRPVTLIGHSMGSLVALECAAIGALRLDRMVLVSTAPRMRVHPALLEAARSDLPTAARLIAGWSFHRSHRGGHPEPGTWQKGSTIRLVEASAPGALATDLAACMAYDAAAVAPKVSVTTLVVTGADDRMTPAGGSAELAALIPDAELSVVEGTGHEPMTQAPHRFNSILAEFLVR